MSERSYHGATSRSLHVSGSEQTTAVREETLQLAALSGNLQVGRMLEISRFQCQEASK